MNPAAAKITELSASVAEGGPCFTIPLKSWNPSVDNDLLKDAVTALERGKLLYLPHLPFPLTPEERAYLRPDCVSPTSKSVKYSLATGKLWGAAEAEASSPVLAAMLRRYAESAVALAATLFPGYTAKRTVGNTSFRPVEAADRVQSLRHDDRRLHVDAFPSRPSHGDRLLRVFTNIGEKPRVWRVGEDFSEVAARFLPSIPAQLPGSAALLKLVKITKSTRTPYDHIMLHLHDKMKFDERYQSEAHQATIPIPPGASWIVYSDQVSHAAMSGQYLMEQTITLPVDVMADPETSPLRVLERMKGKKLA